MPDVNAIITDLVIALAAALPIVLLFRKLRLPTIVGFLLAGVLIGPHGLAVIRDSASVEVLAEIGIVMLLFVVGLELSISKLAQLGSLILWSATIQIFGTFGLTVAVAMAAGVEAGPAIVLGFLVTHSSTAMVLKLLSDRGEIDAPQGRLAAAISVAQDLTLVPMVLLTRALATQEAAVGSEIAMALLQSVVAVALIVAAAKFVMPKILGFVVRQRSRELFAGTVVTLCFGTAGIAAHFDLSLAIGALLAGLVISESEYSDQVIADILPFRDVLNSLFFISIGMLLRPEFVLEHFGVVVGLTAAVIVAKALVVVLAVYPFHGSARVAVLTAFPLATIGEITFVLAGIALPLGMLAPEHYAVVIPVAVLTLIANPFLLALADPLADWLERRAARESPPPADAGPPLRGHVIVVGFGLNGQNLARVLDATGLPFLVIELNPERVTESRRHGVPIVYGDATRARLLESAGIHAAAVLVVAISDPAATRRIVAVARAVCPQLPIIVRTRYVAEVEDLERLGATEVIPEEFETSVEIFARVLRRLHVPRNVINLQVDIIRGQSYGMLRGVHLPAQTLDHIDAILARALTESYLVGEDSPACGRTIRDLDLRGRTGVTILAVVHDGRALPNPGPDTEVHAGDTLVLFGAHVELDRALALLESKT